MNHENEKSLNPPCKRTCAYATTDRSKVIHKWTFLAIVIALVGTAIFYFAYSNHLYKSTFNSIVAQHENYILSIDSLQNKSLDDYIIGNDLTLKLNILVENIDKERKNLIQTHKENIHALNSLLEAHSQRISNDFENLTLWASVLMIIFLVFSIYAMYKMDEMQNRGHESLNSIYDARDKVRTEIEKLNDTYNKKIEEMNNASQKAIKDITSKTKTLSDKIIEEQSKYDSELKKQEELLEKQLEKIITSGKQTLSNVIEEEKIKIAAGTQKQIDDKATEYLNDIKKEKEETLRLLKALQDNSKLKEAGTPTAPTSKDSKSESGQSTESDDKPQSDAK